jgi:ATP/ADP translocase
VCIYRIIAWRKSTLNDALEQDADGFQRPNADLNYKIGGSIFAGIRRVFQSSYLTGICLLMLLYTTLSTFLYFQQAQIIRDSFHDPAARTAVFAAIELYQRVGYRAQRQPIKRVYHEHLPLAIRMRCFILSIGEKKCSMLS